MKHSKYDEIHTLVNNNINVLCTGMAGSGKTTILRAVAEDLGLPFYAISMTKQTTLSNIMGFLSIDGNYIPSQFREAVQNGGVFLMDELDGADVNTILCINTLENGFVSFPDEVINVHPDFRLVATSNPQDQHHMYTGRSRLDAATLDRFDIVNIELDESLELHLTDKSTQSQIQNIRTILEENNSSTIISMRDSIRFFQRKKIGLGESYHHNLLGNDVDLIVIYDARLDAVQNIKPTTQERATTLDELWDIMVNEELNLEKE